MNLFLSEHRIFALILLWPALLLTHQSEIKNLKWNIYKIRIEKLKIKHFILNWFNLNFEKFTTFHWPVFELDENSFISLYFFKESKICLQVIRPAFGSLTHSKNNVQRKWVQAWSLKMESKVVHFLYSEDSSHCSFCNHLERKETARWVWRRFTNCFPIHVNGKRWNYFSFFAKQQFLIAK